MLGLGSLSRLLGLGRGSSSGLGRRLGSGSGLGRLRLLGGDVGQLGGIEKRELGSNSRVDWLVVDRLVPTRDVGVLLAPLRAEEELEAAGDDADGEDISEGDALADEVGVVAEVSLGNGDGRNGSLLGVLDGLLVVGVLAQQGAEPSAKLGQDLAVEERHPSQDRRIAAGVVRRPEHERREALRRLTPAWSCRGGWSSRSGR